MSNMRERDIEAEVRAYPFTLKDGYERQYTDAQLREFFAEKCEHGNYRTETCDCGSGDMDLIWCTGCA